jgi:hypothetical protein
MKVEMVIACWFYDVAIKKATFGEGLGLIAIGVFVFND